MKNLKLSFDLSDQGPFHSVPSPHGLRSLSRLTVDPSTSTLDALQRNGIDIHMINVTKVKKKIIVIIIIVIINNDDDNKNNNKIMIMMRIIIIITIMSQNKDVSSF